MEKQNAFEENATFSGCALAGDKPLPEQKEFPSPQAQGWGRGAAGTHVHSPQLHLQAVNSD